MAFSPISPWQIDGETVIDFIFLGSKFTADGDCSHEIKICLLLGRKAVTNLDSILKGRDITLPTKVCIVIAMVSPVVMNGFDSWTIKKRFQFSSVESLSHVRPFVTPWTAAHQASLSITYSQSLFKLMSIESVISSNHLILCPPLLLLPSIFPRIGVFPNESTLCIRWPKHWIFSFNISHSNEYSGFISFRIDWFDLLAVQGILKSLLQHHSSKASAPWHLPFFMVQLSHPFVTAWKKHSFD